MPPPPGSAVLPGARPAVLHGGIRSFTTGGWTTMRRRASSAVAAALVLVAVGAAAAIGTSAASAATGSSTTSAASTDPATTASTAATTATEAATAGQQDGQSPVSIAITGMTPRKAVAGSVITVTGTVTNNSSKPVGGLSVGLLSSATPITSETYLQPAAAELADLASTPIPGATSRVRGRLQPRATVRWTIRLKGSGIGMSVFGVYPIEAQVADAVTRLQLASALTYLPYTPKSKGSFGNTIPGRVKISWIWPLISTPLLTEPWQRDCQGQQAKALASSLSSTGRLGELVAAGAATAGTADTYGSASGISRSGQAAAKAAAAEAAAARTRPAQNLADYDGITWAIDPALVWDVQSLAGCGATQPQWAKTASAWLAQLSSVSAGQPMFVTPYADPNAGSLIAAGRSGDVSQSFSIGRTVASSILRRDLEPAASSSAAPGQTGSAAVYWPPDGTANYPTLETLAGNDGVRTALLSSSALPAGSPTVSRYLNGGGGYLNLVLASQSMTQLLLTDSSAPTSAFATGQQFLAETALLAQQDPGQPIIVAPPQRWGPAQGAAADLLAATASAPWLSPASLTSLTGAKNLHRTPSDALHASQPALGRHEAHLLARVDSTVSQLQLLRTVADQSLYQAVATDESSAWRGKTKSAALAQLSTFASQLAAQEQDVQIVAEKRVTLGGLRGTVPVSIDNRLDYPVQVRLVASAPNGFKVAASPAGLITIPAHDAQTVRLHVTASTVGSNTVSMSLVNKKGQPLSADNDPTQMTIQATQVGVLGAIVCAIALGVFLIAYAARAVRRGRPALASEPPGTELADTELADRGPLDRGSAADKSTAHAEPDTVMTEQRELGAARTPGSLHLPAP